MGSRKASGAWRSNIIRGTLSSQDTIVSIIRIDTEKWHAGGMSVLGDILAIPVYKTGEKSTDVSSSIVFYYMKNPEQPKRFNIDIERCGEKAGAVALTKLPNGYYLVAVWSDSDKNKEPRLDFYRSKSKNIFNGFEQDHRLTWESKNVKAKCGQKKNFGNFQSINFINQVDKQGKYKLYLVGTHNNRFLSLGKNYADLYKVSLPNRFLCDPKSGKNSVIVTKVKNKKFPQAIGFQFNMDAAAGVHIDPSKKILRIYSSYYWRSQLRPGCTGSFVKFCEFKPKDDLVACKITDVSDSWIELYEHQDFNGQVMSVRDLGNACFPDYKALYVQGKMFRRCVSSARFQIPKNGTYRLFSKKYFEGQYIDLKGTGEVEEIKNFKEIKFGDKVSSGHPDFKEKKKVNFGDKVLSSNYVEDSA